MLSNPCLYFWYQDMGMDFFQCQLNFSIVFFF